MVLTAILTITACGVLLYLYFTVPDKTTETLARYGVHFNPDAEDFVSPNLKTVRFEYDGTLGRLPGPDVTGDTDMIVENAHVNSQGLLEFDVRTTSEDKDNTVWIQLLSPPVNGQAFHVSKPKEVYLRVIYPIQKDLAPSP